MLNFRPQYSRAAATQRWVFSYADLVTILLVLFIAIAAQGLRPLAPPPRPPPPPLCPAPVAAPKPTPPDPLLQAQRILEQHGLNPTLEPRGLVVSLPQAVLFPSGEDQVSPSALPVVSQIADALRDIPNKVSLIGHADAVPIHNRRFRDNWVLSVARGLSLLEVLNKQFGIPEARLSVAGYGAFSPRESNDTAESRAANRRVEIVILHEPAL
jgi:chemotaxis protein MotB